MALLSRVLLVSVEGEGANMKALFPAIGEDAANIVGHVLQIPFVYQTIDLAGFFVPLVVGIRIVHNADETDSPQREKPVYVLFHQFQLTGKAGLSFAEDDIKFMGLSIR